MCVQLYLGSRQVKIVVIHLALFRVYIHVTMIYLLTSLKFSTWPSQWIYWPWNILYLTKSVATLSIWFRTWLFCFLYNYEFLKSVFIISVHSKDRIINPRQFSFISHIDHNVGHNLTLICIQNHHLYTCNKHEMIFKR